MNKGYYKEEIINKFSAALVEARAEIRKMLENGETPVVKISNKNTKMGEIPSASTLPFLTCPARCGDTCGPACYAAKLANLRKTVLAAYAWNTALSLEAPEIFHQQIIDYCRGFRFFRYHVSGDIQNKKYYSL